MTRAEMLQEAIRRANQNRAPLVYRFPKQQASTAVRQRNLVARRIAAGLCGRCGEPAGHAECRRNNEDRDRRAEWRRSGRCARLGCPLPEGYRFKCCEACRKDRRDQAARRAA